MGEVDCLRASRNVMLVLTGMNSSIGMQCHTFAKPSRYCDSGCLLFHCMQCCHMEYMQEVDATPGTAPAYRRV